MKALAEPIFVRGVSPFYDRRTLRPPELEGLRNLPQKFHFPYWGRKGKENKSRPSKTRRSAAQTSICAAARAGIFTGDSPTSWVREKQKHPQAQSQNAPECRSDGHLRRGAGGLFTGGSPTSRVRKKTKTHPSAKPKRAGAPLRRAFAPRRGRALYSGVYVRSRGGAKRSISGAMARFGGGCGSCGEPWGNLRLRSSPCPDRFPRLSFRHAP